MHPSANVAPRRCELSERRALRALFHCHRRIAAPHARLVALGALHAASASRGMPTAPIAQKMREALDQLVTHRPALERIPALLPSVMERADIDLPSWLSRFLAPPGLNRSGGTVPALLELGLVDEARAAAAALPGATHHQRSRRTRMIRLAETGIVGTGDHRRFLPAPEHARRFPPSLPVALRCIEAMLGGQSAPVLDEIARDVTETLSPSDRQTVRAHRAMLAWQRQGAREAVRIVRSIRYRSVRAEAGLALMEAALREGQREAAEGFLSLLPEQGRSRERGAALLALEELPPLSPTQPPTLSVAYTLRSLRSTSTASPRTMRWAAHNLRDLHVSTLVLQALDKGGDLAAQLEQIRARLGHTAADHLWSAHIVRRCRALHGQPPAAGEEPASAALRDEHRMLTAAEWPRRRMVARVCRIALLQAAPSVASADWPVRLRTLGHIGGDIGANALLAVLERADARPGRLGAAIRAEAAAVLVRVHPERALSWLGQSADTLPPLALTGLLEALSARHLLPPETAAQWQKLCGLVANRPRAAGFCEALLRAWRAQEGGLPTPTVLEGACQELQRNPEADPTTLFVSALRGLSETLALPPLEVAAALADDPLQQSRLRWVAPERLPHKALPWSGEQLGRVLRRLADGPEEIHLRTLARLMERIPSPHTEPLRTELLYGKPWSAHGPTQPLVGRARLRMLDKRRDLLTFLRLADAVPCCWDTRSHYSEHTHSRILSLWRDPLSVAFHVEVQAQDGWRPTGFVFGSLGLVDEGVSQPAAALLLNGLYLRRQRLPLRAAVLAALEQRAEAIGVRNVGIANRYNAFGAMPARYRLGPRRVRRLRALSVRGCPVQYAVDDISMEVNTPRRLTHLYWHTLGV